MIVAVVGHVEWIRFARVDRVPEAGAIAHATEAWEGAGGGGGVAAVQLAKLAGESHLFTAFGDDDLAARSREDLERQGTRVHATERLATPTRSALTMIDPAGERTIVTLGERLEPRDDDPLPWDLLRGADAVVLTAAGPSAVRLARAARILVATTRILPVLRDAAVALDAVVGSRRDPAERCETGDLVPAPGLVVRTDGSAGGSWETADGRRGVYAAAPPPGPVVDTYGAGDSFMAGLAFALGQGRDVEDAVAVAARCGAAAVTGRGPTGGQLTTAG